MEAFLLTLDVVAIILLGWHVRKVSRSNRTEDMGWFAYSEKKIVNQKRSNRRN